jgi:hypothetical protein
MGETGGYKLFKELGNSCAVPTVCPNAERLDTSLGGTVHSDEMVSGRSPFTASDMFTIVKFVKEVERRAEQKILITKRLEGAHYAAMKQIVEEWRKKLSA